MDQNQSIDNDLQKAIDSITNETNIDPVFSDPVAAPSSIPEGDTGELGEPIGPFANPNTNIPAPEPSMAASNFASPAPLAPDYLAPEPIPGPLPTDSFQPTPAPEPAFVPTPEPIAPPPAPEPSPEPISEPEPIPEPLSDSTSSSNLSMHQVKKAALRDLVPLIDKLNMSPSQRFNMCRSIFEDLRDYTVLEQAYRAATEIPNSTERAEALLYLVESIDKM